MTKHPLQAPGSNSPLLQQFLGAAHIDHAKNPLEILPQLATAFTDIPFENLTKIIKSAKTGSRLEARRFPEEVLAEHAAFGTGGTCFSLTATQLHLVRALGFSAEPILADRRYGQDTHSALLVWIDAQPHLLDPGYLIVKPIPLTSSADVRIDTSFNKLKLTTTKNGRKIDLHTIQNNSSTYRLTYKTTPVDAGEFLRAWDASFEADMMRYPVLTRISHGRQLYLQKNFFMTRDQAGCQRREISPDQLIARITEQFGIAPGIAANALNILDRKGEKLIAT